MIISNKQINRAGEIIRSGSTEEKEQAITLLNHWRRSHMLPLENMRAIVDACLKQLPFSCTVGQRLKRMPSIIGKIIRFPDMTVSSSNKKENTRAVDDVRIPAQARGSVSWKWPVQGRIIEGFSNSEHGNKGIDISGARGSDIKAASGGKVVYAGNALRGYGNLIILSHNDDFLSAYAHNDSILVREGQQVSRGQVIAKMGDSEAKSVRLHFEIRYRGQTVNPMKYLPQSRK